MITTKDFTLTYKKRADTMTGNISAYAEQDKAGRIYKDSRGYDGKGFTTRAIQNRL